MGSPPDVNASMAPFAETSEGICPNWNPPNHIYFHVACSFLLLSYLTPGSRYGPLYLRATIGVGSFFFALWGYVVLCSIDTIVWNSLFTIINLAQGCLLLYGLRPASFTVELETVYKDLFQQLGVSRRQFQAVACCVKETLELGSSDRLAVEKVTPNDNLSLLLSGNLLTTKDCRPVQLIGKYEFVESADWFDVPETDVYQVTAMTVGACKAIVWSREKLRRALRSDFRLRVAFDSVVGKDLARKLNSAKMSRLRSVSSEALPFPEIVKDSFVRL